MHPGDCTAAVTLREECLRPVFRAHLREVSMIRLSLLTSLLLAAFTAAAVNSASAATKAQCETQATDCLGTCAGIDSRTVEGSQQYGRCMTKCDGKRTTCLMEATDAAKKAMTVAPQPPKTPKPGIKQELLSAPAGIKPATDPSSKLKGNLVAPSGLLNDRGATIGTPSSAAPKTGVKTDVIVRSQGGATPMIAPQR